MGSACKLALTSTIIKKIIIIINKLTRTVVNKKKKKKGATGLSIQRLICYQNRIQIPVAFGGGCNKNAKKNVYSTYHSKQVPNKEVGI